MQQHAKNYQGLMNLIKRGRDPYTNGVPFKSFARLYLQRDSNTISLHVRDKHIADVTPDDELTFVATPATIWSVGNTLSGSFSNLLPVMFANFDKGRYRVVPLPPPGWRWSEIRELARKGQEYFQHLKLDLKNNRIINTKDMKPVVDTDKRKQWVRNLATYRMRLRTMAKLGVFDSMDPPRKNLDSKTINALADAIMAQDYSQPVLTMLVGCTKTWKYRQLCRGDAVVHVFNGAVQNNSRDMRLHLGVISVQD